MLRCISYGGGVQSTALVVLAAQGFIDYPLALFVNVGETAEHPATLAYVRDVAMPWAAERGVEVLELHKRHRDGTINDLRENITTTGGRQIPIPVRTVEGAPGIRSCTEVWKVKVVTKELRARGASAATPATVAVGISTDELERAHTRTRPAERVAYPLLDLRLDRSACAQLIRDAGLPVPPKSACYFCPFKRPQQWAEMRRDEPDLFEAAAVLEDTVITKRAASGRDPMYLTRFGRPLREAIGSAQDTLPGIGGPESCDEGYCWT